ncbi:DarT ssDNA thymidine ADP-ribosyltransferase family protein [Klebsiella michiganensis]|uniref:DarT ssDNA thymidine ADP-ribosyltransferase family protein n=1 Tax=Klebsiella michiganensis TaxID=1134687 RepID=UPI00292DF8EA|nr:DarT ssDNA thymidine ADP-ribosyltransferase family protein [Klebsiella michiganensis]
MTIEQYIEDNGISEILHFTTERGLTGCAGTGLVLSRKALNAEQYLSYISSPVSSERKEAQDTFNKDEDWLDYINLSISEINTSYFKAAKRWFIGEDRWWCIMAFDPIILTHQRVYFTTTNNIYTSVKRTPGIAGLQAMFAETITRWRDNAVLRNGRPQRLTTCEQAEVLYPNPLDMKFLKSVYVQDQEQAASIHGTLRSFGFHSVNVIICPDKFLGVPNTF